MSICFLVIYPSSRPILFILLFSLSNIISSFKNIYQLILIFKTYAIWSNTSIYSSICSKIIYILYNHSLFYVLAFSSFEVCFPGSSNSQINSILWRSFLSLLNSTHTIEQFGTTFFTPKWKVNAHISPPCVLTRWWPYGKSNKYYIALFLAAGHVSPFGGSYSKELILFFLS